MAAFWLYAVAFRLSSAARVVLRDYAQNGAIAVTYQVRQACGVRGEVAIVPSGILAVYLRNLRKRQLPAVNLKSRHPHVGIADESPRYHVSGYRPENHTFLSRPRFLRKRNIHRIHLEINDGYQSP